MNTKAQDWWTRLAMNIMGTHTYLLGRLGESEVEWLRWVDGEEYWEKNRALATHFEKRSDVEELQQYRPDTHIIVAGYGLTDLAAFNRAVRPPTE